MADDLGFDDEGTLVLEQRFAIVPEWRIDAPISDCAFRLSAVLLRYGQTSGQRMPGRAVLAKRLHKSSKDTVDRALKELVGIGAVVVERWRTGRRNLTNRYHLRSTPSGDETPAARTPARPGGRRMLAGTSPVRIRAATHAPITAATLGRNPGATLAASVRPDPEVPTESNTPPPGASSTTETNGRRQPPGRSTVSAADRDELLEQCGIGDLVELTRLRGHLVVAA